jgi:cellulose synthase/poly-beta-1,6-N-acetylglucosamine synthase-like glycosyltransferase
MYSYALFSRRPAATTVRKALVGLYLGHLGTRVIKTWRSGIHVLDRVAEQQATTCRRWQSGRYQPGIKLVIFLPLLREQANVAELLRAICRLEFPPDRILVVPITTEREEGEIRDRKALAQALVEDISRGASSLSQLWNYSRWFAARRLRLWALMDTESAARDIMRTIAAPSTREILERLLEQEYFYFPVLHVHYPHIQGNKASQMNYALEVITREGVIEDPPRTYVGVYDADSRPHPMSLLSLALHAEEDLAPAFQQFSIYLAGAQSLGAVMRNEAWLQTARSIAVEYPRQLRVNKDLETGIATGKTFTYCIGHGEFLRADWLVDARFPEKPLVDDIPTGFMLSLARQRIVPLPFFDICTVPNSVFEFWRQTQTWFRSQLDYSGPVARANHYFGEVPLFRCLRGGLEQLAANMTWLLSGPLDSLIFFVSLAKRRRLETALILALLSLEAWVSWQLTRRLLDTHLDTAHLPRFRFHPLAVVRPTLKSIGPWLTLFEILTGRHARPYKTER